MSCRVPQVLPLRPAIHSSWRGGRPRTFCERSASPPRRTAPQAASRRESAKIAPDEIRGTARRNLPSRRAGAKPASRRAQNPLHPNQLLPLARRGNLIRRLHPHQRIHPHAERLLDPQRHVSRQPRLPIQQTGQRGPRNPQRRRCRRYRQPVRLNNLRLDKRARV